MASRLAPGHGLSGPLEDGLDRLAVVGPELLAPKHPASGDKGVCAVRGDLRDVVGGYPTIDLNASGEPAPLDLGAQLAELGAHAGNERLTAESRVHGHDENQVTEISGLENLINLQELRLNGNNITKLEGLGKLTNLRELWIQYNQLTEIKGLENLKDLERLYLHDKQLTKIRSLGNLSKLKKLKIHNNPLNPEFKSLMEKEPQDIVAYCQELEKKDNI